MYKNQITNMFITGIEFESCCPACGNIQEERENFSLKFNNRDLPLEFEIRCGECSIQYDVKIDFTFNVN